MLDQALTAFSQLLSGSSRVSSVPDVARSPSPSVGRISANMVKRMYALGKPGRLTSGWGTQTTSEDTELSTSLRTARNRSRELVRDAAYAKRAKVIIQNNLIGTGIGMQAKVLTSRGELNERINDEIEEAFEGWMDGAQCHTGEALHLSDMERQLAGQVFEAGEILVRMHPKRFGPSRVPLALEVIEPERIADEFQPGPAEATNQVRLGVEVNSFGAAVAYWIRNQHPGELRMSAESVGKIERVPARDIIHLRVIDRWPQTRAMPWMHASGRKFNDMDGLTEAEITASRGAACYMGFIETPDSEKNPLHAEEQEDGSFQQELEPALIDRLAPGEKFNFAAPNRPNAQLDPFMRMMLREVAAGTGPSYESLSRDYSQSNYSSSRLALMDDRDLWRVLQMWFIRTFRARLHRMWLQQAVMAKVLRTINVEQYAVDPARFEAVRFKPRGWGWIDPTKEVQAYEQAIRNGFTTVTAVIAATGDGRDLEDVLKERKHELKMMSEAGLMFDTDPSTVKKAETVKPETGPDAVDDAEKDAAEEKADAEDQTVKTAEKMLRNARG